MVGLLSFLARRVDRMKASEVRELLKWVVEGKVISFGGGLPDPSTFPTEEELKGIMEEISQIPNKAFQYGATEGVRELREEIVRFSMKHGIKTSIENVIITTGSQQALDIIGRIFIDQRDIVIVELPTYLAAIQAFGLYMPHYMGIPMDEEGMRVDLLEEKLEELRSKGLKPKFIYTIPTCQNPAGISMSMDRRKHLLELASKHDLLIVEDDPYSYITFEPLKVKSLKSMDEEGRVIYMSTFSKIFSPGIRVGWVIAETDVIKTISLAKQSIDLCTSSFTQYLAYFALKKGLIEGRIPRITSLYKRKRDAMLEALSKYMSEIAVWSKPIGGMFIFAWLPETVNTKKMLMKSIKEYGVAYVPGASCFVDGSGWNTMRLNYSYPSLGEIDEGIRRLSESVKSELRAASVYV